MISIVRYTHCPVCDGSGLRFVLTAKDHTVTGETFPIVECANCSLRFTQDVPDAASIGPYYKSEEYISHSDTSKGFINRVYKAVRKQTLAKKRKLVENVTGLHKGTLLDVGSGTGSFASAMAQYGWKVTGLEPDEGARSVAEQLYNIRLKDLSTFYQLEPGTYNAISLWHVLEHVHDLAAYVDQLKNLLHAKGKLLIAVPNYTSVDAKVYDRYWAAYDVPRHLYHFSPRSMKALMEEKGLKIVSYRPMWYDAFYISLLSSKYKNGRSNWIGAGWTGVRSNFMALTDARRCSSVIYVIEK